MLALGGIWKKFLDLLPIPQRQVGTVVRVGSLDQYTVQLVSGGLITVRGASGYLEGDHVFITGGWIESKASSLPYITIDV